MKILYSLLMVFILASTLFGNVNNKKIKGKIFEDIAGDGLVGTSSNIKNVDIYLYKDTNNNSLMDASDVLQETTTTNRSGKYKFFVNNGKYFVVVDSTTITKGAKSFPAIWAEQTYGPSGGLCNDGGGGKVTLSSAGACYGGRRGNWDDASALVASEHVTMIDINNSNVTNVDFGFSFNVVVNHEETGQGSLRQFIKNANEISGANKMRFVPSVVKNESSWWSIELTSALPEIINRRTTIDGKAYNFDGTVRDDNSGSLSGGVKLGTGADGVIDSGDEPLLVAFDKPELEIVIDSREQFGFKVFAHNINIRNIALYGASGLSGNISDEDNGNIHIAWHEDTNNIVIENNFIGVRADGSVPATKSSAYGINFYISKSNNFLIHHNYISSVGKGGIYLTGSNISNGIISQNEVQKVNWFGEKDDGIGIESGVNNIEVIENYVHDNNGPGFETYEGGSNNTWYNNTVYNNGHGSSATEFFGMRLVGSPGIAYQNHIYGNKGAGILIQGTSTSGQKISKNSIYNNGTISIDLDVSDDGIDGDGVTPNNGIQNSSKTNEDMDFPIFTKAIIGGTTLHVEGYVGSAPNQSIFANVVVEIFKVDDDGDANGEGRWYLGSCVGDAGGNIDCNITTSLLTVGDFITATATDTNNNTSEFGDNRAVVDSVGLGCQKNAMILNNTKNIYELDTISGNKSTFIGLDKTTNAIGYNKIDGYIWGYNNEDRRRTLVRIGKDINGDYKSELFGPILGAIGQPHLPWLNYMNVGDIDQKGHLYLLCGTNHRSVYIVDLNSSSANYLKVIKNYKTTKKLNIDDWAFHPNNGKLYAVNDNGRLHEIDPSNGNVNISDIITGLETNSSYESFFDDNGYMYAYGAHAGKVYRVDLTDPDNPVPEAVLFSTFTKGTSGDSARCSKAPMGDVPIIEIEDVEILEGHSGSKKLKFFLFSDRNIIDTGGLRVDYTVAGSDANVSAGEDYALPNGHIVIPQGEQNATIEIEILGDTKVEKDESFLINITENNSSYYAFDSQAQGTILNDDYDIELRAVDTTSSFAWEDGKISTKIANKAFGLTLLAYNHTLGKHQSDMNITKIELDGEILWDTPLQTDAYGMTNLNSLIVPRAAKEADLKIFADFNKTHNYISTSSDRFAVRPKTFDINVPESSYAGENFNLQILALDEVGSLATDYNETNSSFTLTYKQNNEANCSAEGNLTLPNLHFQNGEATYSVKYSEVGRLDFNISEIVGNEFALVDASDTPDEADRIISIGQNSMAFIPDRFDVNWTMAGETNYANILFFADLDSVGNMGANIRANIKALSKDGNVTKNYTNGCLSHDTRLTIDFNTDPLTTERLVWQDMNDNTNSDSVNMATNFIFDINASAYDAGEANVSLKVNFSREVNRVKNPLRFEVSKIVATADSSSITGVKAHNKTLDIYYGRLHVPDLSTESVDMEVRALYEVYCDDGCNKSTFTQASGKESADSINWYVIGADADAIVGNATSRGSIVQDTIGNVITLQAPKTPYVDRVWYTPRSWLVYNRYSDSATKHSFRVEFAPLTSVWSGKGKEGETMERDSSRRINKKMDW